MKKAYAGLHDVGDRGISIDLKCLGDGLAALGAQVIKPETAKRNPIMTRLRTDLIMASRSHYPPL